MKLLLVLLFAGIYHYCDGTLVTDDEISEEVLILSDTSDDYWFDSDNITSSNDSLIRYGSKSKIGSNKGKIGNNKGKIGGKTGSGIGTKTRIGGGRYIGGIRTRTNSGSGTKNPQYIMWVLIGIGGMLVMTLGGLTLYYCLTRNKHDYTGKLQRASHI